MLSLDKLFLVTNIFNSNWTCAIANIKEREIKYCDIYKGNVEIRTNYLIRYLKAEQNDKKKIKRTYWNDWKKIGDTSDIQLQPNGEFFTHTRAQA